MVQITPAVALLTIPHSATVQKTLCHDHLEQILNTFNGEIIHHLVLATESLLRDVCVCVFFPSILDIKFVGRTSRGHTGGRSHRIFNPPSFCGACLDFCREKDSAIPFPRRPRSRIMCTNELIVLHPLGIFILVF